MTALSPLVRLHRAASLLNPFRSIPQLLSTLSEAAAILRDPPGDPVAVDAQAGAFHSMAAALAATGTDAGHALRVGWEGEAAGAAIASLKATRDLAERASAAMRTASDLLLDHAEALRRLEKELAGHREDLAEARRELDSLRGIARGLWRRHLVGQLAKAWRAIRGGIDVYERLREAEEVLRRGMREVEAQARAGALRSPHIPATDTARLAATTGILSTVQLKRAAARLDALSTSDRQTLDGLLTAAASDAEKAYILKALAAGHPIGEVERFATAIHGMHEGWLHRRLDPIQPGVKQFDPTTCGPTVIMVAQAMNDPIYALSLTPGTLRAEQHRIHDSTNFVWPRALGTTPWGVAGELGAQWDWRAVDDTSDGAVLDSAVAAADEGHTVPVLIGNGYPRHYVLLIGHEGTDLVFYNPSGAVVRVSEADFRDGDISALGYRHVQAVVIPSGNGRV